MNITFEEKIREAITNKAFDRCLGCIDLAIKEIKKAAEEEFKKVVEGMKINESEKGFGAEPSGVGYDQAISDILKAIEKL